MTPLVLLPGLACDEALWAPQLTALSGAAMMQVGNTFQDDDLAEMAARVLADAPPPRRVSVTHSPPWGAWHATRLVGATRIASSVDTAARTSSSFA